MKTLLFKSSLLLPFAAVSLTLPVAVRSEPLQSTRCKKAIARMVTDGDRNFRAGNLLCPQDFVIPVENKQPKMLCFGSWEMLASRTGRVGELCTSKSGKVINRGGEVNSSRLITRGNEYESKLIRPFGLTIIQRRPNLTWKPTQGASEYMIRIDGYGFRHEQLTSKTYLSYPSSWPSLEYGNVYDIDIFAYQGDKIISADRTKVSLLFEKDAVAINENVAAIKRLPFPLSEVALELDALYISHQLIDESIQLLEGLRETGKSTPQLNQLLEKRYSQVGYSSP